MPVTATQRILSEDVLTTKEACEELRPIFGKPIDRTTLYRWAIKGIQGNKLEFTKIGGRTSPAVKRSLGSSKRGTQGE